MRLVHAADLHVDSPLRGLSRLGDDDLAQRLRTATRVALDRLVDLVLEVRADALVIAGDLYDGDWHDWSTGHAVTTALARLSDHGVPVVTIAGNHDAASEITRSLRLPSGVRALSTGAPQTVTFDDVGLAVHGQGFATRAVTENIVVRYPDRLPGYVNVGLLHSSVEGAAGHDTYAPCSVADITGLGYDYVALGHVHDRRVLADGEHTVAFSGNLQGRHPRETGPKGAWVVDVDGPGAGARMEFRALDVARWESVGVDVGAAAGLDDVLDAVGGALVGVALDAQGRDVVARVRLTGATRAAGELLDVETVTEQVRSEGARAGVTVEKVSVRTTSRGGGGAVDADLLAAVAAAAGVLAGDEERLRALLGPLAAEVGPLVREAGLLDLTSGKALAALVGSAGQGLDAMLRQGAAS